MTETESTSATNVAFDAHRTIVRAATRFNIRFKSFSAAERSSSPGCRYDASAFTTRSPSLASAPAAPHAPLASSRATSRAFAEYSPVAAAAAAAVA
eukprot:29414-Pelagococcus_subviridis.AAC.5